MECNKWTDYCQRRLAPSTLCYLQAVGRQRDQDRITRDNKAIAARLKSIEKEPSKYNKELLLVEYERKVTSLLPASYINRYFLEYEGN